MKIKRGTVRDSDGWIFWSYITKQGKRHEHWCSPETFLKRTVAQREYKASRSTPESRAARRAAYKLKPQKKFTKHVPRKQDLFKNAARSRLHYAVQFGKVVKPDTCSSCGVKPESKKEIHAHHTDYSKALDVEWLCRQCHDSKHVTDSAVEDFKPRKRKWDEISVGITRQAQ